MRNLVAAIVALATLPVLAQSPAPAAAPAEASKKWFENITPFGYLKAGYFFVTPAADDALVGAHNGLRLANVRLGVSLKPAEKLEVVASIDGSVAKRNETDPLNGNRVVDLKDGYVEWTPNRFAALRIGQFKAPFDQEALLPDGQLPFISRSIVSDGVTPPEGYPQEGLSLDRQLGVQIASDRLGPEVAGLRYAVAAVNGNGANVLNNDNNSVGPVARLSYEFRDLVTLGVNGFYDDRLEGVRPNRLQSTRLGYGGDLGVHVAGVDFLAVYLSRQTTHKASGLPAETATGLMGQVHYLHQASGIEGGARFATYEPSNVVPDDRLSELAVMVGYRVKQVPLRFLAQLTLRGEEKSVEVANDSVDVMAQVSW